MIGDPQRGSAWTRALLGLPAGEVHLCGDASALGLVEKMCHDMGEELTASPEFQFRGLQTPRLGSIHYWTVTHVAREL
jgi:ATP-dependent RNA helicase SUPV3L1/SUV3